ncbi:hypothetical protein CP09DC79_0819B, partial [Chlamydia psittaci 09DC79]
PISQGNQSIDKVKRTFF